MSIIDRIYNYAINKRTYLNDVVYANLSINDTQISNIHSGIGDIYEMKFEIGCQFTNIDPAQLNKQIDLAKRKLKGEMYRDISPLIKDLQYKMYERTHDADCLILLNKILEEIR